MIPFLNLKQITAKYIDEIQEAISRVVESGYYLQGNENSKFEHNYSNYIGVKHTIGVANGLDALRLIFRAYMEMGIMCEGDDIIVPANTYIASILAITENRLNPILVEPQLATLQIDETKIKEAITPKTKGIMIVHLYGRCAFSKNIEGICRNYNLRLIEDNAQAHGCMFNGRKTGGLGDAAGHSFYPGKNLGALGDGGAVTTNDFDLAELVRTIANYGSKVKYFCNHKGINSRLDEIQAAVLNVKLKYLDKDNQRRKEIAKVYREGINNSMINVPKSEDYTSNVYHIFPIFCTKRDELQEYLFSNGVQTLIHYPVPPHKQLCYSDLNRLNLPITELIHKEELSLPISPVMTMEEVGKVISALNDWRPNNA